VKTFRLAIDWFAAEPLRLAVAAAVLVALVFGVGLLVASLGQAAASAGSVAAAAAVTVKRSHDIKQAVKAQDRAARAAQPAAYARNRDPEPRTASDLNDRWSDL
jgi:hypothetical protein